MQSTESVISQKRSEEKEHYREQLIKNGAEDSKKPITRNGFGAKYQQSI